MSLNTVGNWERGIAEPKNGLVWENLAKALSVSLIFLQHGRPVDKGDFEIANPQDSYGKPQFPAGLLRETTKEFDAPSSRASRADCEAHVKAYLDAAEKSPDGISYAFITIRRELPLDDFKVSDAMGFFEKSKKPDGVIAAGHPQEAEPLTKRRASK